MANRVSEEDVAAILEPGEDWNGTTPLAPFIAAANGMVTWCVNNAATYGKTAMDDTATTGVATHVEKWLAAGLYKMSDQQLRSSQAGRSSGQFRGQDGKRSEANLYLQTACMLDTSKTLAPLLDGRVAGASWLGKLPVDQTSYDQRNQ